MTVKKIQKWDFEYLIDFIHSASFSLLWEHHYTFEGKINALVEMSLQITVARPWFTQVLQSVIQVVKASNSFQNIHKMLENNKALYWSSFYWQFTQSIILFDVLFLLRRCSRERIFGNCLVWGQKYTVAWNITWQLFYANRHISSAINAWMKLRHSSPCEDNGL